MIRQIFKAIAERALARAHLEDSVQYLGMRIDDAERYVRVLVDRLADRERALAEADRDLQLAVDENKKLMARVLELEDRRALDGEEIVFQRDSSSNWCIEALDMAAEIDRLNGEVAHWKHLEEVQSKRNIEQQLDINRLGEENRRLLDEIEKLRDQQEEPAFLRREVARLESELGAAAHDNDALAAERDELKEQIAARGRLDAEDQARADFLARWPGAGAG